jgi:Domain of unknown function (DUF397)
MSTTLRWRRSSRTNSLNCVEVAWGAVRDSKDPDGPILRFGPDQLARFVVWVSAEAAVDVVGCAVVAG